MGSSTAYFLMSKDTRLKVAVVEMDPTYTRASSALSMANTRIQFSLKQNIQISQFAFDFLERFEEEMAVGQDKPNLTYRREGNLFLVDESGLSWPSLFPHSIRLNSSGAGPDFMQSIPSTAMPFWANGPS